MFHNMEPEVLFIVNAHYVLLQGLATIKSIFKGSLDSFIKEAIMQSLPMLIIQTNGLQSMHLSYVGNLLLNHLVYV